MATPDPFAPPSPMELAQFAAPTAAELNATAPKLRPIDKLFRGATSIPGVGLLQNTAEGIWNTGVKAASGYAGMLGAVLPGEAGQGERWVNNVRKLEVPFTQTADPVMHPLETAATVTSGFAGMAGAALPGAEGQGERWRAATQRVPQQGAELLQRAVAPADRFIEQHPNLQAGIQAGGEAAVDIATLLGTVYPAASMRGATTAGRESIANSNSIMGGRVAPGTVVPGPGDATYLDTPAAAVSRAGLDVTPLEVQRQVAGSGESVTGSSRANFGASAVNREVAMNNAPRVNEIALEGMPPEVRLSPGNNRIELGDPQNPAAGTIEAAKRAEGAKYDAIRQVPGEGSSPELHVALNGIERTLPEMTEEAARQVQRVLNQKSVGGNSTKLVEDIKQLRQEAVMDARRAFNTNDPDARTLARSKRAIADALEGELARRGEVAGLVGVRETLAEARVNFAKLATLEEAWDQGFINSARLEKVTEGGGYLSDGLARLAEFNKSAPHSLAHPQSVGPVPEGHTGASANPIATAQRGIQNAGGNFVSRAIGRSGVRALNDELRAFQPRPAAPPAPPPTFDFPRAPMGPNAGPQPPMGPPRPLPPNYGPRPPSFAPGLGVDPVPPTPPLPPGAALVPWENPIGVGESLRVAPTEARFADSLSYEDQPGSLRIHDTVPFEPPGRPGPVSPAGPLSLADQLGPVQPLLEESIWPAPAMPDRPRGVTGPRSASLRDPRLPRDLRLLDDNGPLPPQGPEFGAGDEFPGPVTPEGPPPAPAAPAAATPEAAPSIASDLVGDGAAPAAATAAETTPGVSDLFGGDNVFDLESLAHAREMGIDVRGMQSSEQLEDAITEGLRRGANMGTARAGLSEMQETLFSILERVKALPEEFHNFYGGLGGAGTAANLFGAIDDFYAALHGEGDGLAAVNARSLLDMHIENAIEDVAHHEDMVRHGLGRNATTWEAERAYARGPKVPGVSDLVGPAEPVWSEGGSVGVSLADDLGDTPPLRDVTEVGPENPPAAGAKRIKDANGEIDYKDDGMDWRITRQFTEPGARKQGEATRRVVELARKAEAENTPLHSDVEITSEITSMMRGAKARGELTFDESNPQRMDNLLAAGETKLRSSVPWFQNIRPGK